jgi:hypothetical protein
MLRLTGRKADGWLPSLGVLTRDELREANRLIDATAEQAGRDPRAIRRILNLQGVIGDGPAPARASLPVGYLAGEPLAGPHDFWVDTLAGYVADGFDTLVFWPVEATPDQVELLARVRTALAGGATSTPGVVTAYFEADARRAIDVIVSLFTDDAVVVDERQTWRGLAEIRAWQEGPASRYVYSTEVTAIERDDDGRYRATGRLEGNFPGGTADLTWSFTISGGLIGRLEIAP